MTDLYQLKSFIPTTNSTASKHFYQRIPCMKLINEDPYGMEFECNGSLLRITLVKDLVPQPFTILGWHVADISDKIIQLNKEGIFCEKYDFLSQDELGIWTAPGGTKVAWFKDPDGNILCFDE